MYNLCYNHIDICANTFLFHQKNTLGEKRETLKEKHISHIYLEVLKSLLILRICFPIRTLFFPFPIAFGNRMRKETYKMIS